MLSRSHIVNQHCSFHFVSISVFHFHCFCMAFTTALSNHATHNILASVCLLSAITVFPSHSTGTAVTAPSESRMPDSVTSHTNGTTPTTTITPTTPTTAIMPTIPSTTIIPTMPTTAVMHTEHLSESPVSKGLPKYYIIITSLLTFIIIITSSGIIAVCVFFCMKSSNVN